MAAGNEGWLLVDVNSNPAKTSCPVSASSVAAQGDTASRAFGGTAGAAASSDPARCSRCICAIAYHYFVEDKYIGDLFLELNRKVVAFWRDDRKEPTPWHGKWLSINNDTGLKIWFDPDSTEERNEWWNEWTFIHMQPEFHPGDVTAPQLDLQKQRYGGINQVGKQVKVLRGHDFQLGDNGRYEPLVWVRIPMKTCSIHVYRPGEPVPQMCTVRPEDMK